MWNEIKSWWNWFVTSSADPIKLAATARGLLMLGGAWLLHISMVACGLGIYCLGVDDQTVNQAVEAFTNVVYAIAILVGAAMTLFGLVRKWANGRWSAA